LQETNTVLQYWFDVEDDIFMPGYSHDVGESGNMIFDA
jgi:hypothetical protein